MADELDDPREVPWHPRLAKAVVGHDNAAGKVRAAMASGRPHHAWLLHGPSGIGKATLAYALANEVLGQGADPVVTRRWIETRAHPDFIVLERSFNEPKPRKLRSEISVDDARAFIGHFDRTASGSGWRVGLVDCLDELNDPSSNALLKLIEEPPPKVMLLLLCHQKGRVLRTLRSRCISLQLSPLTTEETRRVLDALPLTTKATPAERDLAADLSNGSPGRALELLGSAGAAAFATVQKAQRHGSVLRANVSASFGSAKTAQQDYRVFMGLLLEWLGEKARQQAADPQGRAMAQAFSQLQEKQALTEAYNLDRRTAVLDHLCTLEDALKAA